jgi:alpha-galactosidase
MRTVKQVIHVNKRAELILAFVLLFSSNLFAQKIVTIPVTTKDNALVLQTDKDNRLWIIHFGKKLQDTAGYAPAISQYNFSDANAGVYNSAYTPAGTWSVSEPALQVTHADGNPSLDLKFAGYELQKESDNISTTFIRMLPPMIYRIINPNLQGLD